MYSSRKQNNPMRFWKRQPEQLPSDPFSPDMPLLYFSKRDVWRIADALKHTMVFGASGSGKTSGSLATLARIFLQAGFGGLVLCAKPEERLLWERYAQETGRSQSLVVMTAEGDKPIRFNFLDYELRRQDRGGGSTANIVNLFSTVIDLIENNTQEVGGDKFWDRTALQSVGHAVDVLSLCNRPLTLKDIKRFIQSVPLTPGQIHDRHWQETAFCAQRLSEAYLAPKTARQANDFEEAEEYFLKEVPELNPNTRSSIFITFTSLANMLLKGDAWELLSTHTTIVPEVMYDGAVVVLDLPIQQYGMTGRIIQGIIKYTFQQALLRRNLSVTPRPVFLFGDEYQQFLSSFDYQFLSVARSAGVACVFATQNVSNLYSVLGAGGKDQSNSFLGNCATKIFHANTDVATNQYASDVIGQEWMTMVSTNRSDGGSGHSHGASTSASIHASLLPSAFVNLRTGGIQHDREVEAYLVQTGRGRWHASDEVYHKAIFHQGFGS